jgi:fatty acid desaturase
MVDQHVETHMTASDRPVAAPASRVAGLPIAAAPANEGKTVAAWTTVAIIVVGAIVAALGVALGQAWLDWTGAAIILAGLVVGAFMRRAGFGQPRRAR